MADDGRGYASLGVFGKGAIRFGNGDDVGFGRGGVGVLEIGLGDGDFGLGFWK